jgi:uncharacterized delta-60 repeat protein
VQSPDERDSSDEFLLHQSWRRTTIMLTGQNVWRLAMRKLWNSFHREGRGRRLRVRRQHVDLPRWGFAAEVMEERLLLTAGTLDTSFGTSGVATMPQFPKVQGGQITPGGGPLSVLQSNGESVLVIPGRYGPYANQLVVGRLTTSGTLDTTFGNKGYGVLTFKGGINGFGYNYAFDFSPNAVAVQSDGKIVVAGTVDVSDINYTDYQVFVARFNANGSVDSSFGKSGLDEINLTSRRDGATGIAITPQGKILLSVYTGGPAPADGFLQLTSSGARDTTFGSDGLLLEGNTTGVVRLQTSTQDPNGYEILLGSGASGQFTLQRFYSNGSIDTTFGTNGTATATIAIDPSHTAGTTVRGSSISDLQIEADGKIVAVGGETVIDPAFDYYDNTTDPPTLVHQPTTDAAVARFNANGSLDTTFGAANSGTISSDLAPGQVNNSSFSHVTVDASLRPVAVGWWSDPAGTTHLLVARYTSAGQLDPAFGAAANGTYTDILNLAASGVNIQSDGKILVATGNTQVTEEIRLLGDPVAGAAMQSLSSGMASSSTSSATLPESQPLALGDTPSTVSVPVTDESEPPPLELWLGNNRLGMAL